ncbi:MAG TPA: hypothetical protein VNF27_11840 [Candidatus Binataceae bacterium]|nr:hypothetical protein [Candidatus Binataceae bacterium]
MADDDKAITRGQRVGCKRSSAINDRAAQMCIRRLDQLRLSLVGFLVIDPYLALAESQSQ